MDDKKPIAYAVDAETGEITWVLWGRREGE